MREGNGLRRQHTICIGNKVLVRQKKRNKLTPAFSPEMYTVTRVKGSMITGRRGKHEVTRDASMFKKLAEKREVYSTGKRRVVKYKEGNREWHQGKNSECEEGDSEEERMADDIEPVGGNRIGGEPDAEGGDAAQVDEEQEGEAI